VAFDVPRRYVLDGGKGLHAGVRKMAGKCAVIQRCQEHKIRNVVGHLTGEYQSVRPRDSPWGHWFAALSLVLTPHSDRLNRN
jgi:hypothetical protein